MKKTFLITLIAGLALLISIPQVFALELRISQNGNIYFYEDSILGDDEHEEESEDEEDSEDEHDDDDDDDDDDDEYEKERDSIRTSRLNGGSIRVSTDDDELRVDFIDRYQSPTGTRTGFDQMESSRVDRFEMELPAGQSERQQSISESERELAKDNREDAREAYKDYLEKLREERKDRLEEKIELKSQQREDGKQELEFESRGVSARIKNAEFEYDSETGVVTLTTPSGEVHELNHLPDQAIDRMIALSDDDLEDTDIEIETSEDGSIEYRARGSKETKLFGFISRDVDTEITLDDDTGEVVETQLPATSILGRFLDSLSF